MAHNNQDAHFSQEPKARLPPGMTGPEMAADAPHQEPPSGDHKEPTAQDYSGLQVLETGLEVAPHSELPEAVLPQPHPQYAEYKPWPQYSSPQQQPPPLDSGAYIYPVPVTPGSTNFSSPYSGDGGPNYQYHGGHNPFGSHSETVTGNGRICGMRKKVFWVVLAIVIFAIVAAIAIGLGVGLGTRSDPSAAASTTATHSLYTATGTFPAATATSTADSDTSVICPSANRTLYSLKKSSTAQKFLVLCGRDYNSCCGAEDMYTVNTTTFEDCLEECGSQAGCVGVGWGNYYGTNTCWLKSSVGEPNWSASWYAAVAES